MNDYQIKKQIKIDRLLRAAKMCRQQADQAHESAHKMADIIPFGQPILIGHHSERRDRNYRNRIQRRFEKSFELQKKAEYYEQRAHAAQNNTSISSDDPEAITLLKEKIAKLEDMQTKFKLINKIVKSKKPLEIRQKELAEAFPAYAPERLNKFFEEDFCGRVGVPDYELTNNNANIRRLKQRLAHLERHQNDQTTETTIGAVRIVDNTEENRVQVFFPGKPSAEIRQSLKSAGFHWSPYAQCWQRMRSNYATHQARAIAERM
jgi:hypothetical protein